MAITANLVKELRETTGAGMMDCKKALSETNGDMEKAINYLREKGIAKSLKKESRIAAEGLANIYIKGNNAVILEVNSETDFVSKNEEFISMIDTIGNTILKSDVTTLEEANKLKCEEGSIADFIIAKTARIGEKLSLRRFERITKKDNEVFGEYIHMGGKIAVLALLEGANEDIAKDVAMQVAAMKPLYVFPEDVPGDILDNEKEVQLKKAMEEGKPEEIAKKMVEGRIKKYYQEVCLAEQPFIKDDSIDVKTFVKNNDGTIITMRRFEVGEGMEKRSENFAEEVMKQINN
ncbi:MAG: elongation factor Ts [Mollicutes bacterium]|nr:elongation factor Ts [Mollicutes bacterium]